MTTTILQRATLWHAEHAAGRAPTAGFVDLTRGAVEAGIRGQTVWLDATLMDEYAEPDASLGRNVGGVILSVLARHLDLYPDGLREEVLTICLIRREDAIPVEVDLRVSRSRYRGISRLALCKVAEREASVEATPAS